MNSANLLRLIVLAAIWASAAPTATFLSPFFGIVWGMLFLSGRVGWHTLLGAAVVVAATALVTGFTPFGQRAIVAPSATSK